VSGIELARTELLWALLALAPWLSLRLRRRRAAALPYPPLQYGETRRFRRILAALQVPLEVLVLGLTVLALTGPHRTDRVELLGDSGLDLALVLDVSASMQAADFPPNRLEALKALGRDLVERSAGDRIAVVAFAGHTFTHTPLTTDHQTLLELLDGLAYESISHARSGGTALGDALLVATDTLARARVEGRDQVAVLITDGESNLGVDPLLAARHLRAEGLGLHVIGLGGDEPVEVWVHGEPFVNTADEVLTTSLDDAQLRTVAAAAGGRYWRAESLAVLTSVFEDLARLERTPLEATVMTVEKPLAPELALVPAAAFAAWALLTCLVLRRPLR
jgi:Ca-activated chloride channel family protein